jgi:hypothetical protein
MDNKKNLAVTISFYAGAIALIMFGLNYMKSVSSYANLNKQEQAAAQVEQPTQSRKLKATATLNQSGNTIINKSQNTVWVGSTTQDNSFLAIQFPLENIPANTTFRSAKLQVTPVENSQSLINALVFVEKTESSNVDFTTQPSKRALTSQFVLLNETKLWTRDSSIELANLTSPFNEQIKFNSTAQFITIMVKGLQKENSRRDIYAAGSEYPPELHIEFIQ